MNDSLFWLLSALLFVLDLLINTVFVSMNNSRWSTLIDMREENEERVGKTIALLEKPYLAVTLRGSLVVLHFLLIGVALYFGITRIEMLQNNFLLSLAFVLLISIIIFAIETMIEAVISSDSENWAVRLTGFGRALDLLFSPFGWIMQLLQKSNDENARMMGAVTEDELKRWVQVGQAEGVLEQEEREMIYSIFHFSDTLCREIMVPRIDVFALEENTSLTDAAKGILESGHSRVPVYSNVIDNVIGLLYAKDILQPMIDETESSIRALLRPAYFVPEAKKVDELLREMQAKGVHISVVVDEYGGMAGLVTLEDIVEEIVGEIRDEYDESEDLLFQEINETEYLFHGRIDIENLNELIGTHLTREVADTLGGYVYGQIGRVPTEGEKLELENWVLTVEQVLGRRIRLVRAVRKAADVKEVGSHENQS